MSNKEKIMCTFSMMFIFYYTRYSYDYHNSFEDYCCDDLLQVFYQKGISILSLDKFKVFAYTFYFQIVKELTKMNYKEIKNKFYKFSDLEMSKGRTMIETVTDYVSVFKKLNFQNALNNCITPLIATKEKIIDMVIDVATTSSLNNKVGSANSVMSGNSNVTIHSNKSENQESHYNHDTLSKKFEENTGYLPQSFFGMEFPNLGFQDKIGKFTGLASSNLQVSSTNNNASLPNINKRIIGEVCEETINEKELEFTNDIALKADTLVELILNHSNHKVFNIRNFLCYIVDINSAVIKLFPEYEDIPEDINLRVIIGARNLYLIALEVYYSIGDLYDINLDMLMQVFKARYPFSYNEEIDIPIRMFYQVLINNILEHDAVFNSEIVLENTLSMLNTEWKEEINKNAKELTYYCTK